MNPRSKRTGVVAKMALLLAGLVFAVALPGQAQSRGGGVSFHPAGHVAGGRPTVHAAGHVATPLNPNFSPLRGVPGLGFDFEHLAAVSRPPGVNHGVRNRSGRTFLTPIFDFGLPYYYTFDTGQPYDYSPELQAPQTLTVPPIPGETESATDAAAAPFVPGRAAPVPELGQLILVRRDGQVLLAVAFTTSSGRLTYITQDGLRRSFPVTELDPDATRQMNDVNGTAVALPN